MPTSPESSPETVFACALPPPELRKRRVEVLASVRRRVQRIEETPEGFTFLFERTRELEAELAEFVRFEAACCPFIHMEVAPYRETALALRMTGVPAAKPFMRAEFVEAEVCTC